MAENEKLDQVRRLLNLQQLMQILPLKRSRIYYLVHTNRLPHGHLGRTLVFDYDEVMQWIETEAFGNGDSLSDPKKK